MINFCHKGAINERDVNVFWTIMILGSGCCKRSLTNAVNTKRLAKTTPIFTFESSLRSMNCIVSN